MGIGVLIGIVKMFFIFPDVVFAKGGYASYPALFAARVFGIPIVIHESDAAPGRVNLWAGKFADKILRCAIKPDHWNFLGDLAHSLISNKR